MQIQFLIPLFPDPEEFAGGIPWMRSFLLGTIAALPGESVAISRINATAGYRHQRVKDHTTGKPAGNELKKLGRSSHLATSCRLITCGILTVKGSGVFRIQRGLRTNPSEDCRRLRQLTARAARLRRKNVWFWNNGT